MKVKIGKNIISINHKTYFVADIAANHDGSLSRAKKLIRLCAKAGANAAKFQHFKADTIVSNYGFKNIGKITHQKKWKKSVYEVYKEASIDNSWTKDLRLECKKNKIDFFTAPYDIDYVKSVYSYVDAYKIGSGDISWLDIVKEIAKKKKTVLIATGASSLNEVKQAVKTIKKFNKKIILMQCNTNYTADEKNIKYLNLNVLNQYKKIFKEDVILGLSDHTFGHNSVLGAVALGARVIEKHFTDNNLRKGPDHKFSMNPKTWKNMVLETRKLENSLGDGFKKVEKNEKQSIIVQRRGIRAKKKLFKGNKIKKEMLVYLRPCPKNALNPYEKNKILGKTLIKNIEEGEIINCKKIK
tara:strand:+ start:3208 stop:4272 length:1065 start_codon:yes stop_codon:yes gene_type:complete